jgi:molecular chaperone DnaK
VNVSAKDLGTNKEQKITITASSGLSKDEIERMNKDAEAHAEEDRKNREKIEARNKLDSLIYNTDKILRENREKIADSEASSVDSALADAKKVLENASAEGSELTAAFEALTRSSHRLAEVMYQKTAGQGPQGGGPTGEGQAGGRKQEPGEKKEEEVIDAEYVDMDDNKK